MIKEENTTLTVIASTAECTREYGRLSGELLEAGVVVLLFGDLGAGKTTFTQGIAIGLGIQTPVTSPTFTLIQEYRSGRIPLYHFDPYRLSGANDIYNLGFEEYLEKEGVVVMEWADRLDNIMPDEYIHITIQIKADETRIISWKARGERPQHMLLLLREVIS